jgi:hypothetical protein
MRKDISRNKQQIRSKAERETQREKPETASSFISESIWAIRTATFVFWIRAAR